MYPLLSDFWPHGRVTKLYGALTKSGFGDRVIVVIDKKGLIRFIEYPGFDNVPDNEIVLNQLTKLR